MPTFVDIRNLVGYTADCNCITGLVFALERSFEEEDSSDLLHYRSLLLVKSDTCMPVMEMKAGDVDKYIMFHDMRHGLGDMDRLDHLQKECTNSGSDGKDDDYDW